MNAFVHLDLCDENPVVTVDRSEGRTRIRIRSSRPGGSSVTVDMPPGVVIPNARRVVEVETATATAGT